jgi:hypothetical protein
LKLAVEGGSPQAAGLMAYETLLDHGNDLTAEELRKVKVFVRFCWLHDFDDWMTEADRWCLMLVVCAQALLQYAMNRGEASGHIGMAYIQMFGIGGEPIDIPKAKGQSRTELIYLVSIVFSLCVVAMQANCWIIFRNTRMWVSISENSS